MPAEFERKPPKIAVRWLPVDALNPDPRNAREHAEGQVRRIADSILAFGFNVPVLIDGARRIAAGHGRVLAARSLGQKAAARRFGGMLQRACFRFNRRRPPFASRRYFFLRRIARKPLKTPESDERIQENPKESKSKSKRIQGNPNPFFLGFSWILLASHRKNRILSCNRRC